MAKSKIVTLIISPERLSEFKDFSFQPKPTRGQAQTQTSHGSSNIPSRSNTPVPGATLGPAANQGIISKSSMSIRVGISGLMMNTNVVRELDKSKRKVSSWEKQQDSVISEKDLSGFKEDVEGKREQEHEMDEDVKAAKKTMVRTFSGYYLKFPVWHKVKEGELNNKIEVEKPLAENKLDESTESTLKGGIKV